MSIENPTALLAQGFAAHVVRWARAAHAAQSSMEALHQAAYHTSIATTEGHACIHISEIPALAGADTAALRQLLLDSQVTGTAETPGSFPLILDREGRLYLHRYFDYERRLAQRLLLAVADQGDRATPGSVSGVRTLLDILFVADAQRPGNPDWQKIATALALLGRLTIISGGPGTGKTTTVVKLLACLIAHDPACRIALTAPTGKAAARLLDAIRSRAAELPQELQARLPGESFTIHRLLGVTSTSEFRHNRNNPLPVDVLIVDEASMLDLALATKLLEAVPVSARIILLGDKDQLAAVESGAVFAELSADAGLGADCAQELAALTGFAAEHILTVVPLTPTPLQNHVVWFSENFRFASNSGIGRLATLVNTGAAADAVSWFTDSEDPALTWLEDGQTSLDPAAVLRILQGYAEYRDWVHRDSQDQTAIFAAFNRFRLLCAMRAGARGVEALNAMVSQHFRQREHPLDPGPHSAWYPGRPVMVLRNDYVLKLFNGDIGIVLPDASGALMVIFPDTAGNFRAVASARLPAHETAFAMTVHKAQGSEFEEVLLVLPAKAERAVTRELLYTAVTRARARLGVISSTAVFEQAVASPTRRYSGLIARLMEMRTTG